MWFFISWAALFAVFCLLVYMFEGYVELVNIVTSLLLSGATVGLVYWMGFSDEAKERSAQQAAQDRADAKPHVIRETDDGCKVYAWKGGDWHYFTRCSDGRVTTERNWTEMHGKQKVAKREVIVTEGNN